MRRCVRERWLCMRKARKESSSERTCMCPLSLSPCHPRVGMLRQTGSLFLGQWQCVNGRRCVAKEGSEIPADRGQSLSLSCSLSISLTLFSALSSVWLLFSLLWIAVLLSFEIVWAERCCTIFAWRVYLYRLSHRVERWAAELAGKCNRS